MKKLLLLLICIPFISNGQVITTFAGNGADGYTGDGGQATAAAISTPNGLAFDASGNVYFSGFGNNTIRKVSPAGIISTIAGNGILGFSGDGGPATNAKLNRPVKICRDGSGNIYIADQQNHRIRKVSPSGIITTIAGNGTAGYNGDGIAATAALLNYPSGVAVDGSGNVLIADYYNYRIRKVSPDGIITTIAGNGVNASSGDGGMATAANLSRALDILVDATGNLYICDQDNARIRKVSTTGIITTIAGTGTTGFSGDGGPATNATFNWPGGIAIDGAGNFFIADFFNQRIRRIDPSGIITTIIGDGTPGFTGDGGPASAARIDSSNTVAIDNMGQLFICDNDNRRIRKISVCMPSITTQPAHDTVMEDSTATYSVMTAGGPYTYQWQEDPGTGFVNLANVWPYSGVTTNTLTINNASIYLNTTHYRCVISSTDITCSDTSSSAILIIHTPITGLEQLSAGYIAVFPNPAHDEVLVKLPVGFDNGQIQLINSIGQVLIDRKINSNSFTLNLANFPIGMYTSRIQVNEQIFYKKIFKN